LSPGAFHHNHHLGKLLWVSKKTKYGNRAVVSSPKKMIFDLEFAAAWIATKNAKNTDKSFAAP
jgi:hypothetical protein